MMKKFPYLAVSGTYRDVGLAIGESFRTNVRSFIAQRKSRIPHYDKSKELLFPYYEKTQNYLPHLIEETRAIAAGADVDFYDFFFANVPEVYNESELQARKLAPYADHCTTIVSTVTDGLIVGHNEDWSSESIRDLYILKATVGGVTTLGLQYCTYIPGSSVTLNSWGLVQCINELYSRSRVGIPKYYIARGVTEKKSINDATDFIRSLPRASGFNHVLLQDSHITNIEAFSEDMGIEVTTDLPFVHTNHCLSPHIAMHETVKTESSVERYKRAKQLAHPDMTIDEMIRALSDKANTAFPICRHKETIASVIVAPNLRSMLVSYGPPCKNFFTRYTL